MFTIKQLNLWCEYEILSKASTWYVQEEKRHEKFQFYGTLNELLWDFQQKHEC